MLYEPGSPQMALVTLRVNIVGQKARTRSAGVDRHERYLGGVDDRADDGSLAESGDPGRHNALPPWLEAWRRRSAIGAVLSGIAFGVRQALEPDREEPAIVAPAPGAPPGPQPLELHLDDDRPEEAWAVVRPWLVTPGPAETPDNRATGKPGTDETPPGGEDHGAR
jgi:hypothetical protein